MAMTFLRLSQDIMGEKDYNNDVNMQREVFDMSKLCLGTYLTILKQCKSKSCTQKKIVGNIMHCLSEKFDETDDSMISNLVRGEKNPSDEVRERAQEIIEDRYCKIVEHFSDKVIPFLDPNEYELIRSSICDVVINDKEIKDETVVDLVSGTTKDNLEMKDTDLVSFLAGIFLYVMKFTNNSKCQEYVKQVNDCLKEINKKNTDKPKKNSAKVQDEEVYLVAQTFCIEHEKELELLPLCQIAYFKAPLHKNIRNLYTDYNKCSDRVKKKILELKGFKELDFTDENWIDRCIHLYEKKIEEMELTTKKFLYDDAKYLHRAFAPYSDFVIDFEPYIFDRIDKSETIDKLIGGKELKSSLGDYIADYLWYKKNKPEQKMIPPMDKLQDLCNWGECPEDKVTFWVCKFIIASCYHIEPSVFRDNKVGQAYEEEDLINISLGDSEYLIERQEDIYYYALLQLYKCFYYQ